jgi:hypothetical protein
VPNSIGVIIKGVMMKLLTKEIIDRLPALGANESKKAEDVKVVVKFFCPWNQWTWYATEMSVEEGQHIFFGYVYGFDAELGEFTLEEMESVTGPMGLKIERDLHFGFDHTLAEVMKGRI